MEYKIDYKELVGKTIMAIVPIEVEYGRNYGGYLGFVCSDGTRVLIAGSNHYRPSPDLKEMLKHFDFFTPEEVAEKAAKLQKDKLRHERAARERKLRQLEQLKRELGIEEDK